jgi:predicted ATPase
MGKSTFIQSLLAVRQSYMQNLFPKTGLSLNGDLVKLGTAKDVLFEYANEEEIYIHVAYKNKADGKFKFDYSQSTDVLPVKENLSTDNFFLQNLFLDNFHYLSAERIGPRLAFDMSDFHVVQHKQIGTTGQYTAHFLATHGSQPLKIEALKFSNETSNSLVANVEAWLGAISPGTRITVTPHAAMGLVNLEFSFARGKLVSKSHRPTNVGFGITFILPVLVALLSSEPGALLLIENPEAHLHPKGQFMLATLMAMAAKAGVQLIIESHSDHFLNGLRVAVKDKKIGSTDVSVNFFEFDAVTSGSKVTNLQIDENGRINHWPVDFFDELEKSLEKLI